MIEKPSVLGTEDEEINLTPLLDCIFILIFFFLVATTLREEETQLEVRLPESAIEAPASPTDALEVVITEDGLISVEGQTVSAEDLESVLADLSRANPGQRIVIASDGAAPMQSFVDVVSTMSRLGISFTDLRTRAPGGNGP